MIMILILSRESAEITTELVIDWLKYYNVDFYRFNGDDLFDESTQVNFYLKDGKWSFEIIDKSGIKINSKEIKGVWYRRSFNPDLDNRIKYKNLDLKESTTINDINRYIKNEALRVYSLFWKSLKDVFWLNKPHDIRDKFQVLELAQKSGIKIPKSFVCNNKKYLIKQKKNIHLITKASAQATGFEIGEIFYSGMTIQINNSALEKVENDFFFPSFFQEEIKKKYELRVFFLVDTFFSVAIFSQNNNKTSVDFRNYDKDLPNRIEIVKIPIELETKLLKLMKELDLNCGSIDIIKSIQGEYYFLEVNPVGQFFNTSLNGNFNLEKLVAEVLIRESYEKEKINNDSDS